MCIFRRKIPKMRNEHVIENLKIIDSIFLIINERLEIHEGELEEMFNDVDPKTIRDALFYLHDKKIVRVKFIGAALKAGILRTGKAFILDGKTLVAEYEKQLATDSLLMNQLEIYNPHQIR